ncbi:long-chain fatty acid--CoA ligase [Paracidovorax avenae]|uniref:class I adenylate-forming enzyme family protein n=1 Tax=Paracidovorax avenae TaxID=80867 RepID=UPI000D159B56|nr:class I adenylate-forming enzyme family protein [Paracidovorax avenae]AVS60482.1 long-chain fatty acid--CoA ligase [Paracidovorax avenae]
MSLSTELFAVATQHPDATAVVEDDRCVSYGQLAQQVERVAAGLRQSGVQPGDRIAIHLGNRIELVALYYACLGIGAVIVPLHQRLVAGEIRHLLAHSGARCYVGSRENHARYGPMIEGYATIEHAWIVDGEALAGKFLPWSALLSATGEAAAAGVHADAIAAIFYTSGTTGTPKGVVNSQSTLAAAVDLMQATMPPRGAHGAAGTGAVHSMLDAIVPWSILMILAAHRLGRAVALLPTLSADTTFALLQRQPLSFLKGTPSHFKNLLACARQAGGPDHAALVDTFCVAGGDLCPPELGQAWRTHWGCALRTTYGMTESGGPIFCQPDVGATAQPSIGWPLPGVDVQQTGTGELLARSPANTLGLWNGQAPDRLPADRWLGTGDLVRRQEGGCYLIDGREKDQLKSDGYPISPLEVEQALLKLPAVAEAVVFGIPDPVTGERAVAMLRTATGGAISEQALKDHLTDLIAEYKHPRQYLFVDRIPMSSAGKLSRKQLAGDYLRSLGADASR